MADIVNVKFGVLVNAEYPHDKLMAHAGLADRLGLDAFWYADERFYREPYTGLAASALASSRIRLGTGVTDPYTRHPALTALAIASLDELSGGRAVLGYGAGIVGFSQMGIELVRAATRLRESIEIIRRLWTGERFTYKGETVSFIDGALQFPARAGIPIYLAADAPHTLRLAGELADGVIIPHCASPLILAAKLRYVQEGRGKASRTADPDVVARLDVSLSRDRAPALHQGRLRLARYLWSKYPTITYLEPHGLSLPAELERRLQEAGPFPRTHETSTFERFVDAVPEELIAPIACAGTPEDVGRQIAAVLGAGATSVMAFLQPQPGQPMEEVIELYAAAVGVASALAGQDAPSVGDAGPSHTLVTSA